jgi:carbonic anhydrase
LFIVKLELLIARAVQHLGVQEIIICTHSHCGACAALYNIDNLDDPETPQLKEWLRLGVRARDLALSALGPDAPRDVLLRTTEKLVAVCQLEHLMTHPYVKRRLDEGKLFLHAWHYTIETGEILCASPPLPV